MLFKKGVDKSEVEALKKRVHELEATNVKLTGMNNLQKFELDSLRMFVKENLTEASKKTLSGYRVEIGVDGCRSCPFREKVCNGYGYDKDARLKYKHICSKHDHRVDGRNGICNYKEKQKCPSE